MDDQFMAVNKTTNVAINGLSNTEIILFGSANTTIRNVILWKDSNIFSGTQVMILNLRSQLG